MPLENNEGDSQLTGSTFNGEPTVVGGVYVPSGSTAAYVQTLLLDPSGAVYVTSSGSLPVHVDSQVSVANFPATQNVSGAVNIGNWPATLGVSASVQLPVFSTGPVAVTGSVAKGGTAPNPVVVAGTDSNNLVRSLLTDGNGDLYVVPLSVPAATTASLSPGWVHYGGSSRIQTAVRGTTYTEQTSAAQRSLKSTSTSDTSSGTGAQQVTITYYDNNCNGPFTEVVTLNGTTAVNTVSTTIRYIEKMVVTRAGSGGSNVGTISIFTTTGGGGSAFGSIGVGTLVSALGDNQTLWSHHYVGNLLTGSVVGMTCGTNGNQTAVGYLRVQNLVTSSNPEVLLNDVLTVATASDSVVRTYPAGIPVLGPARVTMYVVSNGTNTNFYGSFDWQEHY